MAIRPTFSPAMSHDSRPHDLQRPLASVPDVTWDVAVVGAGPAGATAALHLARGGHRVLLVDRHGFPRDKACGDLLIPDSLDALARAGLLDRARRVGKRVTRAVVSSPARIEWPIAGEFLMLKRRELDALVVAEAAREGAVFACGEARAISRPASNGLSAHQEVTFRGDARIRARYLVLATGADVRLPEALDLVERKSPTAVAVRSYVRSSEGPEDLLISFDHSIVPGYGWIFPLPGGEFNVGVGVLYREKSRDRVNLKALLDRFVAGYPPARRLMAAGDGLREVRGARLRCGMTGTRLLGGDHVVVVGESAGTTYPFTGEGVGKAMETGELAAEALHAALTSGDPSRVRAYGRKVQHELRPRYRGYQAAQDWLSRPVLNNLLARRARRSAYLQRKAAEMVAESSDPRDAISFRGLLRSFWS